VAGIIALLLQKNPALTSEDVRQLLQSTTIKDQFTGPLSNPNNIWGAGKVNAYGALAQLTGITQAKRILPDARGALAALKVIDRGNQKFIYITPGTNKPKSVQILLYSLSGRIILSKSTVQSSVALPRTLSKGIYLIDLLHDGSSVAQQKLAVW
jgi:hypothetical protein